MGDLLEYNPLEDCNILRVTEVFLCVDQIAPFRFMFNIVDLPQKISYTEKEFKDFNDFEISVAQQSVNFIGNPRKNKYIPGYVFKVKAETDFQNVRNVLTKCVFEAQNKAPAEKAEEYDEDFLGKQLAGDYSSASQADAKMSDVDDYSFVNEQSPYNAQ